MSDTANSLAAIKELLDATTPEQWEWARYEGDSLAGAQAIVAASVAFAPENHTIWGVISPDEAGQERVIAYTGNGPTSEANARFLAAAPEIVRWLLARLTESDTTPTGAAAAEVGA